MQDLQVGTLVQFHAGPNVDSIEGFPKKWKALERKDFMYGDARWIRVLLDKNTQRPGDEVILEFNPEDPQYAYIVAEHQSFAVEGNPNTPWQPFLELEVDGVVYRCIDPQATQEDNPGYAAEYQGLKLVQGNMQRSSGEIHHWEYEENADDPEKILQFILENGLVRVFTGYKLCIADLTVI